MGHYQVSGKITLKAVKAVPESLDEITATWCESALRKGGTIGIRTKVARIEVHRFKDEKTGQLDGGGLCGAMLAKIKLTYSGDVSGEEPRTMVVKLSRGGEFSTGKWGLKMRLLIGIMAPGDKEEQYFRNETRFIEHVLPALSGSGYHHPKFYYTAVTGEDTGLFSHAVLNTPCRVKGITLMEDLSGWRSEKVGEAVSHATASACLRNAAILHAKFWHSKTSDVKNKSSDVRNLFKYPAKSEKEFRLAAHSWLASKGRDQMVENTAKFSKKCENILKTWADSKLSSFSKTTQMPKWVTAEPCDNGRIPVLQDPAVVEMLKVMSERLPTYNRHIAKPFMKRPIQTLLHGDFHCGNHMYGQGEEAGQMVAIDFQHAGVGMVASDFVYLHCGSIAPHQLHRHTELATIYHDALVKQGIFDYSWDQWQSDVRVMFIENLLYAMQIFDSIEPQGLCDAIVGMSEEKGNSILQVFESGFFVKSFLVVTEMYLDNKEGFMADGMVATPVPGY